MKLAIMTPKTMRLPGQSSLVSENAIIESRMTTRIVVVPAMTSVLISHCIIGVPFRIAWYHRKDISGGIQYGCWENANASVFNDVDNMYRYGVMNSSAVPYRATYRPIVFGRGILNRVSVLIRRSLR